jgi:hypothetical protein
MDHDHLLYYSPDYHDYQHHSDCHYHHVRDNYVFHHNLRHLPIHPDHHDFFRDFYLSQRFEIKIRGRIWSRILREIDLQILSLLYNDFPLYNLFYAHSGCQ